MREKDTSFDIATVLEAQKWDAEKVPAADIPARLPRLAPGWVLYRSINELEISATPTPIRGQRGNHRAQVLCGSGRGPRCHRPSRRPPRGGRRTGIITAFQLGNPSSSDGVNAVAPTHRLDPRIGVAEGA